MLFEKYRFLPNIGKNTCQEVGGKESEKVTVFTSINVADGRKLPLTTALKKMRNLIRKMQPSFE